MLVAKDVLQNLLMALPPVRAWARGHHRTGIRDDRGKAASVVSRIEEWCPVADQRVLEIGPGQTTHTCREMVDRHAREVFAVDIEDYECPWPTDVEFRTYDGVNLPFGDGTLDLVFSHDVFEHVRRPKELLEECFRVLAPGGSFFAEIDVRSHYYPLGPMSASDLRYPWPLWVAMTWNRSGFTNRVRYSEWLSMFDRAGLTVEELRPVRTEALRSEYDKHAWLRRHALDDILITSFEVLARKPA